MTLFLLSFSAVTLASIFVAEMNKAYLAKYMSTGLQLGPLGGFRDWEEGFTKFMHDTKGGINGKHYPFSLVPLKPSAWKLLDPHLYVTKEDREFMELDSVVSGIKKAELISKGKKQGTVFVHSGKRPSVMS